MAVLPGMCGEALPPVAVGRTESCLFCPLLLTQPWLALLSTSQFSPQEFGEFRANVANASLVISKIVTIHSLAGAVLGEGIMSVVTSCAADMQKIPVCSALGHCNEWQGKPRLGFG